MPPPPTTLTALALMILAAIPVEAGLRAQCRRQCDAAVAACVTSTRRRLRACHRQTLRRCRHEGLQVCAPATTTTTTTPVNQSTTSTSTTTGLTTTTLPECSTPFVGQWLIQNGNGGILVSDTCGLDDGRLQTGFSITGCTKARDPAGDLVDVLNGTIDTPIPSLRSVPGYEERHPSTPTSFEMGATIFTSSSGCTYNVFVDATDLIFDPGTSHYQGPTTLTIDRDCGGVSCSTVYSGTGYQS